MLSNIAADSIGMEEIDFYLRGHREHREKKREKANFIMKIYGELFAVSEKKNIRLVNANNYRTFVFSVPLR